MAEPSELSPPALDCYPVEDDAPPLVPAEGRRAWMDETDQRFAYRCTPMTIANTSGWELRCPFSFEAIWDGGAAVEAITVLTQARADAVTRRVASHFGYGVLTFHTGWLLRTPPGWAVWARGAPNGSKDGVAPLEGLVETDWLPFTFTMNWRFTRPGRISFARGEPFCFITLAPHGWLDAVEPRLRALSDDPELAAAFSAWRESRSDFNDRLRAREPSATQKKWQRAYISGDRGRRRSGLRVTKRRLRPPSGRD